MLNLNSIAGRTASPSDRGLSGTYRNRDAGRQTPEKNFTAAAPAASSCSRSPASGSPPVAGGLPLLDTRWSAWYIRHTVWQLLAATGLPCPVSWRSARRSSGVWMGMRSAAGSSALRPGVEVRRARDREPPSGRGSDVGSSGSNVQHMYSNCCQQERGRKMEYLGKGG